MYMIVTFDTNHTAAQHYLLQCSTANYSGDTISLRRIS